MPTYNGAKHWVGFKPEGTPGTAEATVSTFLSSESVAMNHNHKAIARKATNATGRRLPARAGSIAPDGKTPFEVHASQPHPWYWFFGVVNTTQPAVGTDPTVYLHTITDGLEPDSPISLTAEADKVYTQSKQAGVRVGKLSLKLATGEIAKGEIAWNGLSHEDGATLTSTPVFTTDALLCTSMIVKIDGTQDLTIDNLDLEFDNVLEALAVLEVSDAPRVVRRKETPKITGKLKFIDFPADKLTLVRNATTFALIVELQGATISHAYKKFLRITLPGCQITGGLDPEAGDSIITGDADFEAFYDTTATYQALVEAQNTIATING